MKESSSQAEIHRRLSNINQNAMRRFSINPIGTPPFGSQMNVDIPSSTTTLSPTTLSPTTLSAQNPIVNVPLDPVTDIK